jgi:hypothetical protein
LPQSSVSRPHFGRTFFATTVSISARMLEFPMNSIATVQPLSHGRLALIVAGVFALLGLFAGPAQAGYYGGYGGYGYGGPCSYRCGSYYPIYRRHYGCYSCGRNLVYERRYIEREYVERRYGYGYRRHYGCYSYDRCHAGYYPYGGYGRPGYYGGYGGYGFPGVRRRWPVPFPAAYSDGYGGYDEPPRPPAPVYDDRYE